MARQETMAQINNRFSESNANRADYPHRQESWPV